jgi:hypothetical protein
MIEWVAQHIFNRECGKTGIESAFSPGLFGEV